MSSLSSSSLLFLDSFLRYGSTIRYAYYEKRMKIDSKNSVHTLKHAKEREILKVSEKSIFSFLAFYLKRTMREGASTNSIETGVDHRVIISLYIYYINLMKRKLKKIQH